MPTQPAYTEFGDPNGSPVLFFHGNPGDRETIFLGPWGDELRIRFLSVERPGYGTTPFRDRELIDWPDDVRLLTDALGLDRFCVAGVSAGGPYALACAHRLPDRVERAVTISGMTPPNAPGGSKGMHMQARMSVVLARRARPLLNVMMSLAGRAVRKDPDRYYERSLRSMPPSDRRVAVRPEVRSYFIGLFTSRAAAAYRGSTFDLALLSRRWGFDIGSISVPVDLWHGADDTLVPVHAAEWTAGQIPGARCHVLADQGHLLLFDHGLDIFRALSTQGRRDDEHHAS